MENYLRAAGADEHQSSKVCKQLFAAPKIDQTQCVQQVMHIAKGFNLGENATKQLASLVQRKLSEMAP